MHMIVCREWNSCAPWEQGEESQLLGWRSCCGQGCVHDGGSRVGLDPRWSLGGRAVVMPQWGDLSGLIHWFSGWNFYMLPGPSHKRLLASLSGLMPPVWAAWPLPNKIAQRITSFPQNDPGNECPVVLTDQPGLRALALSQDDKLDMVVGLSPPTRWAPFPYLPFSTATALTLTHYPNPF